MYIYFKPKHNENPTYQIVIQTTEDTDHLQESESAYTCTFTLKAETLKGYVVNIKRSDILLNNMNEHSSLNEIQLITGEILSDLDLEISPYGEILKIKNYPEVQKKWRILKNKIENAYKIAIVGKIITSMDMTLQNQETTLALLNQDFFFYHYLAGIYGEYTNEKKAYEGLVWGVSDIPLEVTKYNRLSLDDMDQMYVEFSMKIRPESLNVWQTGLSKNRGIGTLDATLKGNYHFLPENNIKSIDSCFEAYWNQQLFKRVHININLTEK